MKKYLIFLSLFVLIFLSPSISEAHQPRIVKGEKTYVENPEISKAYYSKLVGSPNVFEINSDKPFELYVNILVPDIEYQKKNFTVIISKDGERIAMLDGDNSRWKKFFEPFGYSNYLKGPEYDGQVEAGKYQIDVFNIGNDSKYALAIGKKENFNIKETINALNLIPEIKRKYLDELPISFILSPIGIGYIFAMFIFSFVVGITLRQIYKHNKKNVKNLDKKNRILRIYLSACLFILAINTSWNFILLFLSGFMIFESIFSWCPLDKTFKEFFAKLKAFRK